MADVTLLIPCYNAAGFLPRLLESVRQGSQPFTDVICYDDASTDDTIAVASELGLKVIRGETNRGVSVARNRLVAAANTEWIHFHDADDLIGEEFLERLRPHCEPGADVVSCDADWVEDATRKVLIQWRYSTAELAATPVDYLIGHSLGLNSSIIRRSAWETLGGCNESLAMWEDADVHVRLALQGSRFFHVPEVHTWSLRRETSFSHDYRRSWRCRLTMLETYASTFPARHAAAIISACEQAAHALLHHRDPEGASRALKLAQSLGGAVPSTRNPLLLLCRRFFGPMVALRLQGMARRR